MERPPRCWRATPSHCWTTKGHVLAGTPCLPATVPRNGSPWSAKANEYAVPISPVGNGLVLRAQAYRTSLGWSAAGFFWLVGTLGAMTAWMLIATWRHTRRRMRAQLALVAETNFRRAMENSVLTGMRALDLQGRITYVNAAFCQMTGWSEAELVGQTAPSPIGPKANTSSSARGCRMNSMARPCLADSRCGCAARTAHCSMHACMCRPSSMPGASRPGG